MMQTGCSLLCGGECPEDGAFGNIFPGAFDQCLRKRLFDPLQVNNFLSNISQVAFGALHHFAAGLLARIGQQ